jgi:hypothetical protein
VYTCQARSGEVIIACMTPSVDTVRIACKGRRVGNAEREMIFFNSGGALFLVN